MKKIIIARSNGVEPDSRVEKEANTLAKAGFNVTILAWDRSDNYKKREDIKQLSETSVKRISFGARAEFGAGLKSLGAYLTFQRRLFCWLIIHRKEYDIAHLCDFDTAFIGSKACRLAKKKIVFDLFDYLSTDAQSFSQKMIKRAEDNIINKADATIICTEERKEQIKDATPKKLVVIHNSPDKIFATGSECTTNTSRIKIVYVGILQDYRLIKEMIHAIEVNDDFELHIGGFGKYEEFIEHEAKEYDNVIYYGKLSYKETLCLEQSCDIITAIYDPAIGNHIFAAPNKFYEGLFLGKPLIMVKGTGMSDIIYRNDIGTLIEYSEEAFVRGIKELKKRRNEWPKMSERMRQLYQEQYSWEEMGNRLVNLYEQI